MKDRAGVRPYHMQLSEFQEEEGPKASHPFPGREKQEQPPRVHPRGRQQRRPDHFKVRRAMHKWGRGPTRTR